MATERLPQETLEKMAAEQGPRWPSRKAAWIDGYREGEQRARMSGSHPTDRVAIRQKVLAEVEETLLGDGADAMARKEYELHRDEMGYETVWEEETQGHRNIYLAAARGRIALAFATLTDEGDSEPCERCGGAGTWTEGTCGPQTVGMEPHGRTHRCPACHGTGTKPDCNQVAPEVTSGEEATAKYPPAERLVGSLRWAVGYIDGLKKFDPGAAPYNGGDEEHDWMEWASAHDWLKDAAMVEGVTDGDE